MSGTNGLINIYGGSGTGDFSKFMEFGVEGGLAKVFGSDGYNWTGSAVTLPATLSVEVSPYYANGRIFRYFVNGAQVHETWDRKDVPTGDIRVVLYEWSTTTTQWGRQSVDDSNASNWPRAASINWVAAPTLRPRSMAS